MREKNLKKCEKQGTSVKPHNQHLNDILTVRASSSGGYFFEKMCDAGYNLMAQKQSS